MTHPHGAPSPHTPRAARNPRPNAGRRRRRRPATHFPARSLWEPLEFISCAKSCLTAPAAILGAASSHHGAARAAGGAGGGVSRHVTGERAQAAGGERAGRPRAGWLGCWGYPTERSHGDIPTGFPPRVG